MKYIENFFYSVYIIIQSHQLIIVELMIDSRLFSIHFSHWDTMKLCYSSILCSQLIISHNNNQQFMNTNNEWLDICLIRSEFWSLSSDILNSTWELNEFKVQARINRIKSTSICAKNVDKRLSFFHFKREYCARVNWFTFNLFTNSFQLHKIMPIKIIPGWSYCFYL